MAVWTGLAVALGLALAAGAAHANDPAPPIAPAAPPVAPSAAPPAGGFATHMVGEGSALELHLGERAVFTLVDGGGMQLVRVMRGDAPAVTLADGQVVMTLMPAPGPGQPDGTRLFVRTALDGPLRYHAAIGHRQADGSMVGKSTATCPAHPKVMDIENWLNHIDILVIVLPKVTDAGDGACKD